MYDEGNREVCKMNLLGPLNTSPQEEWLASLKVCVSMQLKPFLKDGNVGCIEELLIGRVWVPSEASNFSYLCHCGCWLSDLGREVSWKCMLDGESAIIR